jgi:uncharacterized repeat protein (TIGR01451 family)
MPTSDLSVLESVSNPTPNVGDEIIFTVTVSDLGPDSATNVQVSDLLPAGLTFVFATATQGTYTSASGMWTVGTVSTSAPQTLSIGALVASPGTQTNTAAIFHADQFDPNPANNSASATETPQRADLSLSESVNNATPNVGGEIIFTVTLSDLGPDSATNVQVSDLLPAGLTFVFATASQGTYTSANGMWTVGTVNTSVPQTLSIGALVASPGTQTNTAAIFHADQFDPNPANNSASATETQQADLSLSESVNNATPNVGDEIIFTVTVSDLGPDSATNVQVSDLLPAGLTFVFATATQGTYTSASGMWTVGAVSTSAPQTLSIGALVASPGTQTNTAAIFHADQFDPNPANNSASATETPQRADLSLSESVSNTTLNLGGEITFTVTLSDLGPNAATNVQVTDLLPAGLTFVVATPSQGTYTSASGMWTVGTVSSVPQTLSITALVASPGTRTNTAAISHADQFDPNPANNSASATETAAPPAGTTADMILRHGANGLYEIYDIGNNAILAGQPLGQVGTDWQFVGLGRFFGNDTTDMLLRSASTGGFEVYDISNDQITGAAFMGAVGMNWQVMGFGDFSSMPGETDMILRNTSTGGVEVYDISNNQITGAASMGAVGLNWQFSGVGNFSGRGTSDMILRNSNTGGLEVYDINNNQITGAAFIGNVGVNWQFSGVGNFSSVPGETDLILRNSTTGGLEVYDINNNQLTGAAFIGTVGLDWQFAGIAAAKGAGTSDLVLRNVNTGAFEVYDIANNQLMGAAALGAVGTDWQLGGFAADPPAGSTGSSDSTSQLVQAMVGFGGGSSAAGSVNAPLSTADTSQQPQLTTPQHA